VSAYAFVERETASHSVVRLRRVCRVLGGSPSGSWAWRQRAPAPRAQADARLATRICEIHHASRGTYGVPRVHAQLAASGTCCGRKRVARLMRRAGLAGCSRRRAVHTTRRDPGATGAPDSVQRSFTATAPDQRWIAHSTYVPTWQGFLYLAVLLEVCSRRVVGWSMAAHLHTYTPSWSWAHARWRSGTDDQARASFTPRTTAASPPR
jgi:putative transposase